MNLHELIFTENRCYKEPKIITPKGICWHSTGANNPNLKRYVGPNDGLLGENTSKNYWNTYKPGGRSVCVHAFIGKLENGEIATYNVLPYNYRAWHCGGEGNNQYLSFEICEDGLNDEKYFNAIYKEAVEYSAYLCNKFNFNPLDKWVITCHQELYQRGSKWASNHADILHWMPKFGKTMDIIRNDINDALQKLKEEKEDEEMTQEKFNEMFDARMAELANEEAPDWMKYYLNWMKDNGLMSGDDKGNLMGLKYITRGEASAIFKSFYENMVKNK